MIYFVRSQKQSKKWVIFKLKIIQKRILRRFVDVYKIIATKTLKIEIHVLFINIHLKRLLQNSIINMNIKRLISAVETTMQQIKRNLISKRKRKSKLRIISLQAKRRWMRKYLKKTKTTLNQLYIVVSKINFSKMIIEIDKTRTSQTYDTNTSNLRWRIYSNESEKNENITTTTMNFNWNREKCLKGANITLAHHDKLKNLIIIVKKLVNHCEKMIDAQNKSYKIYFNNQASLKIIYVMSSMFNQKKL